MPETEGQRLLKAGAEALDLSINDEQIRQLLHYLDLLLRWNKAYNLIANAPYPTLVARHLLDSLAVLPHLKGITAVDMGTGAGLPGMPLALADTSRHWWLVDSAGKRIRFLRHVVRDLGLANVTPMVSRMEAWTPPAAAPVVANDASNGLNAIILRAVTSPSQALNWVQHLLVPGCTLYLMMARQGMDELSQLPPGFELRQCQSITVPFLTGERHLAMIETV
ncbi:MAG: 16S rRNA (guanine(527)-N(7))-methyltransferase RsmG [Xanthomonadales bacterium]|nr:16S rRNA (guanine(527)-N(7))-methyltransferase RsmG [Xanthomonadales bacterium]